jgi:hypothetical protein
MKKIFQSTKNFFRMAKAIPQNSTIRTVVETVASNNVPEVETAVVEEVVEAPKPKAPRKKKVKEEAPKVEKVTKKTKKKDA